MGGTLKLLSRCAIISTVLRENESCRDTSKVQVQEGTVLEGTSWKAITTVQVRDNEGWSRGGGSANEELGSHQPA